MLANYDSSSHSGDLPACVLPLSVHDYCNLLDARLIYEEWQSLEGSRVCWHGRHGSASVPVTSLKLNRMWLLRFLIPAPTQISDRSIL